MVYRSEVSSQSLTGDVSHTDQFTVFSGHVNHHHTETKHTDNHHKTTEQGVVYSAILDWKIIWNRFNKLILIQVYYHWMLLIINNKTQINVKLTVVSIRT